MDLILDALSNAAAIDSSHYGDPQKRLRVFILAAKRGMRLPLLPSITHGPETHLHDVCTAKNALGDLESVPPVPGSGIVQLPNGNCTYNHTVNDIDDSNDPTYDPDEVQLRSDKPGQTITTQNKVKHYLHHRYLTIRELAR
jgi:site-specific DNA-cytosine methylase